MKTPLVFSFVKEQSRFMSALVGLLSFLAVLSLGISLSIGTAVVRWNGHWDLFATVQVMPNGDTNSVQKIIDGNKSKFKSAAKISNDEISKMLGPWLDDGRVLENYVPAMWEIEFKSKSDMKDIAAKISDADGARFIPHKDGMKQSTGAGIRIMLISGFVLLLILGAVGLSISYITRNIILIHRRELSILNQIGARDNFITRQLMIIIARICAIASGIGFLTATPVLLLILSMAQNTRIGLMSQMVIPAFGWVLLVLMPAAIIIAAAVIVRKTTLQILDNG